MVIKRKHRSCYDCEHYIAATDREVYERGETINIIYDCINDLVIHKFADKNDWRPGVTLPMNVGQVFINIF